MDKITKSLLDSFSTQYQLEKKEESTQFEHFSNYSIVSKINKSTFDIEDVHVGSGGDCAIDGLCLIVNGKIVTSDDEIDEVVQACGYLDGEIVFIQSKTTSSFSGADIGSFIYGVKDFLSDNPKLVQSEQIKSRKYLWEKIIEKSTFMTNRRPFCKLFYVCTGKWVNDQNLLAVIENGKKEIDAIGLFDDVDVLPFGAVEIQKLYHETKNKLQATILFDKKITLPDIAGVNEAYLGVLPFLEYMKLIQDENQTIHSIFDDNVRDFQGENDVNKKIKDTLSSKKFDLFSVLNNGVTVVAASLTPAGNRFTLRDYQIVNGCQTSNVLHSCQKIEGIEAVNVPIKIIVTDNEDIKTEITLATNSQTEVRTEQLEALSAFQKRLELYYNAEKDGVRLFYERRSQQYNSNPEIKRSQIVTIPIQIKSFASMFLRSPHLVTGYYGTIVNRFRGKIFGVEHKFSPYFVSALCFYRLEQYFKSGEISSEYKKFRFHIMMISKLVEFGAQDDLVTSNAIDKKCEKFKNKLISDSESLELFQLAISIFNDSGVDKSKRQLKSESETELLIRAAQKHNN